MTTNVIPMFAFNDQQLRGVRIDGEPWFVAADACRCLQMNMKAGTTQWLRGLDEDEKMLARRADLPDLFSGTSAPTAQLISRPGLFKLIQRSNKPEAKEFDRWVRHVVLPQIMDNGGYVAKDADVGEVIAQAPANPARAELGLMRQVMSAMQAMQDHITKLEAQAVEAAPKVAFVDQYVEASGTLSFADVGRTLGMTAQSLCARLREKKVLFHNARKENVAYKAHIDAGRFVQKTASFSGTVVIQTRVTAAGAAWIAEQLPIWAEKDAARAARHAKVAAALSAA